MGVKPTPEEITYKANIKWCAVVINPFNDEEEHYGYPKYATKEKVESIHKMAQLRSDALWAKYNALSQINFLAAMEREEKKPSFLMKVRKWLRK